MVRLFIVIGLLMLLAPSEAAAIDSGSLQLFTTGATGSLPFSVSFGYPFSTVPAFAIFLTQLSIVSPGYQTGYVHNYGSITSTSAAFSISIVVVGSLNYLTVRWVATADPLLQLSPITVNVVSTGINVFTVPTTFQGASQFGASVTQVFATSLISSFNITTNNNEFYASTMIAQWSGSDFGIQTLDLVVTQKTDFYGTNSPFFTSGGNKYVRMWTQGYSGSVIYATLVFHVIDTTQTGVFRGHRGGELVLGFFETINLLGPYNLNGVSPTATRVFGLEAIHFSSYSSTGYDDNRINITTTDGKTAIGYRRADLNPANAEARSFFASYASACGTGCLCDSSFACVRCQPYRAMTVDSNGVMHCTTCLPGFYLTAANVCEQCPMNLNCATCAIASGATTATCTSCNCAQQRQLVGNQCVCIGPAYIEASPPVAYCVKA